MAKKYRKILVSLIIFFQFLYFYLIKIPQNINILDTANFSSASATLGNSRLSYRAGVASGTSGTSIVTIDGSGNPDNNTNHLFTKDTVCFTDSGQNGCIGSKTYTVANIIDGTNFNTSTALTNTLLSDGYAVASQSGSMVIAFTTTTEIPSNGDLLITIPMADNADGNDGLPDTSSSVATNGFDLNGIVAADISVTGCTDANWVATEVITEGSGTTDHTIRIDRQTSTCAAASAIVVTIDSSPGIVNPAPITSGHTQGTADGYSINVISRDGSDNELDTVNTKVAPVEAVFVSATVDESLSFTIAGISADSGDYCGVTRTASSPDSTAYSVPWGTIPSTYAEATHNAAQQLTVSTNATSGYKVYAEENDQMGRNGNVCTGATPSAGEYTFSSGICIRDTACGGTPCTHTTPQDWTDMATYPGFGYSLEDQTGTDAQFEYNDTGTFQTKQFADQEAPEVRSDASAEIMTNAAPVAGSSVYVCYRVAIPGTQPAGYYYNKIKYTAVPTF